MEKAELLDLTKIEEPEKPAEKPAKNPAKPAGKKTAKKATAKKPAAKKKTTSKTTSADKPKKQTRPYKEIDKETFEGLCRIQCTELEICDVLGVTDKTLAGWCRRTYGMRFSEVFKQKRVPGLVSLRRWQFDAAEAGNITMLVWLGKQCLGQRDKPEENKASKDISDEVESLLSELEMED